MRAVSVTFIPPIFSAIPNAIFSRVLEYGAAPYDSLSGPILAPSGLVLVHASHLAQRANDKE